MNMNSCKHYKKIKSGNIFFLIKQCSLGIGLPKGIKPESDQNSGFQSAAKTKDKNLSWSALYTLATGKIQIMSNASDQMPWVQNRQIVSKIKGWWENL